MKNILQEIHGRSLWQVFGLYLASSWVVLQVVDTLDGVVGLPAWVGTAAIGLLLAGLPIVMTTAFVQRGLGDRSRGGTAAADESTEESATVPRRAFTWRNALIGGVGAFTLLGVGTAIWIVMRTTGIGPAGTLVAKGVLDEKDTIVLADFENSTADETLAAVVTEALRVDLAQAEAVELADPGFLDAALARMQRPAGTLMTEDVAFDLARREGVKAVVTGEIARAGAGYLLTTSILDPEGGRILLSHRETARDSTELLDAIDALGRHLRERVGDPLKSIAASPPLEQVTTSNLEALRSFSQGVRLPQADASRRIALFEAAVAADSTFASAWNALSIQLSNYGVEPGRAREAQARAFALRENLPPEERAYVSANYYLGGTNEPRQAIPHFEALIAANPDRSAALNNLGEAYRNMGDLETALDLYERAIEVDSANSAIPFMNIAQMSVTMGDTARALRAADYLEVYAGEPFPDWHRAAIRGAFGDYESAEVLLRRLVQSLGGRPFLLSQVTQWLGDVVGIRGRVGEAEELLGQAGAIQAENGSPVEALRIALEAIKIRGSAFRSRDPSAVEGVLAAYPMEALEPIERPLLEVAESYALLGDVEGARAALDEFDRTTPDMHQRNQRYRRHLVSGEIAIAEGRFDDAVEHFRLGAQRPQELHPMVGLARAFDGGGQRDSALVHYRRFLAAPHWLGVVPHSLFLANGLERAAELEYEAGNLREAAAYYARFVDLWAGADPGLQPRVQAAQGRLQEIIDEIG